MKKLGEKGQVSAELIIVIAALLAVALVFISNLQGTVEQASGEMKGKSSAVLQKIKDMPTE